MSLNPVVPAIDEMVCYGTAVRKASRRLTLLYDAALVPAGLKATQFAMLAELARHEDDPLTMQQLARLLVMDRSTLGHNLRPLQRERLVALRPWAEDRRVRHVVMTEEGGEKLHAARSHWVKAQNLFNDAYGANAAAALRGTMLAIAYDERLSLER